MRGKDKYFVSDKNELLLVSKDDEQMFCIVFIRDTIEQKLTAKIKNIKKNQAFFSEWNEDRITKSIVFLLTF